MLRWYPSGSIHKTVILKENIFQSSFSIIIQKSQVGKSKINFAKSYLSWVLNLRL